MNKFVRLSTLSVAALALASVSIATPGFAQTQPSSPPAAATTAAPATGTMHTQQMGSKGMHHATSTHMSHKASASSPKVKAVQTALTKAGYDVKADGVLGPKTHAAIKKYQSTNGLHATGAMNGATLKKLGV